MLVTSYDGENISRKGDVVLVSVNHRLNVLGFLDLSAYGDKYKSSPNAGLLDLVAALQWIKQNIAQLAVILIMSPSLVDRVEVGRSPH